MESRWVCRDFWRNSGRRGTLASCVVQCHIVLPWLPSFLLSPQPRAVKRRMSGKMATSVNGATTAVRLPAQSHVSTRSLWLAPCGVWRVATRTALQVRPPWLELKGWVLRYVYPFLLHPGLRCPGVPPLPTSFKQVCLPGSLLQSQLWVLPCRG